MTSQTDTTPVVATVEDFIEHVLQLPPDPRDPRRGQVPLTPPRHDDED